MTVKLHELKKQEARHAVNYGGDFAQRKHEGLERYANVDEVTLKRANPATTLEGYASLLVADHERLEIERIRANPPKFDKAHIEHKNPYSIMSLYSDFKDLIEAEHKTWADYRQERKKWRNCRHMFCNNMYPIDKTNFKGKRASRKDSKYCSEACRLNHRDAKRRYAKTRSYLPEWFYLPNMSESVTDRTRRHEFASRADTLEKRVNGVKKNRKEFPEVFVKETDLKPGNTPHYGEETNTRSNLPDYLLECRAVSGKVSVHAGSIEASSSF